MIYRKVTTASTNLDARAGVAGDVFTADFQTAGRGRLDHAWQSERAQNLMFSAVLSVGGRPPAEIATLPLVVGYAVLSALSSLFAAGSARLALKWPNDVLADGRKLCGILCERYGDNVIAGIGVNVNQTRFAADLDGRATSLASMLGRQLDREEVLRELLASLNAAHARWLAQGFAALHAELTAFDLLRGREVSVLATDDDGDPVSGLCGGIQSDGSLLVGDTRVYAGEAHVRSF